MVFAIVALVELKMHFKLIDAITISMSSASSQLTIDQ